MPGTTWGHNPPSTPHGFGYTIPLAVTEVEVETAEDQPGYTRWDGIGVEVRSLARWTSRPVSPLTPTQTTPS